MQKQYVKYHDPLKSWVQNTAFLGIFNPGRYCGFDKLMFTGTNTLRVQHLETGISFRDYNFNGEGPSGKWVTKQGVIITETTETQEFTIDSNAGNDYWRYDILVGEHEYVPLTNNQTPANYFIIKGPTSTFGFNGPVLPNLTNPDRQVILAVIGIPPQVSDLLTASPQVRLISMRTVDTGAEMDAKLTKPNTFKATQQERHHPVAVMYPEIPGLWTLEPTGNGYSVLPMGTPMGGFMGNPMVPQDMFAIRIEDLPLQEGTKITLRVNEWVAIYNDYLNDLPNNYYHNRGYRKIKFNKKHTYRRISNLPGATGPVDVLRTPKPYLGLGPLDAPGSGKTIMILDLEFIKDYWVVKNVYYEHSTKQRVEIIDMDCYTGDGVPPTSTTLINTPSNIFSLLPFLITKKHGTFPWANVSTGGVITIKEKGWVEINMRVNLKLILSMLNPSTTYFDPAWAGPGGIELRLHHEIAGVGISYLKEYIIDMKSNHELHPAHLANYQPNVFSVGYVDIVLKGVQSLKVAPQDTLRVAVMAIQNPADGIIWTVNNHGLGMSSAQVKWLGAGEPDTDSW